MVARTRGSCHSVRPMETDLLGPTNFQAPNHSETRLPGWVERIRTRKCRTQSGPLKCRMNLARCSEHLVTRDFSRESCQPLTRHCELRCVPGT